MADQPLSLPHLALMAIINYEFTPGTRERIYRYDREAEWYEPAGLVDVVEVVDRFLVRVRSIGITIDAESGDVYQLSQEFIAYRHGDLLTFVPQCKRNTTYEQNQERDASPRH